LYRSTQPNSFDTFFAAKSAPKCSSYVIVTSRLWPTKAMSCVTMWRTAKHGIGARKTGKLAFQSAGRFDSASIDAVIRRRFMRNVFASS
jgi:hypothetical protein